MHTELGREPQNPAKGEPEGSGCSWGGTRGSRRALPPLVQGEAGTLVPAGGAGLAPLRLPRRQLQQTPKSQLRPPRCGTGVGGTGDTHTHLGMGCTPEEMGVLVGKGAPPHGWGL